MFELLLDLRAKNARLKKQNAELLKDRERLEWLANTVHVGCMPIRNGYLQDYVNWRDAIDEAKGGE